MKNVVYVVIIIILAALQTTVFSGLQIFGGTADFLLAFTVIIALLNNAVYGGFYGFVCGLIIDALTLGRFGFNTIILMYTGVVLGLFKEHFFRNNGVVAFLCSFLSSFINKMLYFLLMHYIWNGNGFWYNTITRVFIGSLLTAITAVIMYYIFIIIQTRNEKKGIRRRYGF